MKFLAFTCLLILVSLLNGVELFAIPGKFTEEQMKQKDMFNGESLESSESSAVHTITSSKKIAPTKKVDYVGQVGGLDTDRDGNLIVFHRASRTWNGNSFFGNKFNTNAYKAIDENVIDVINPKTLANLGSWGKGIFYMPHGLTLDYDGNIWLTDVGMHQVFKYNLEKSEEPLLSLGVRFEDGNDENHFCKPTDVAISSTTSDVFVSDGYCNQRVVQFDKNGQYIKEYKDTEKPLRVAHSIALIEKLELVCTVSREDGRIVCFDVSTGEKKKEITHSGMRTAYAIEYDPINELLHAVSGDDQAVGFTFNATQAHFGKFVFTWTKEGLTHAHAIAISPEGKKIFVGQLNGGIDEFRMD